MKKKKILAVVVTYNRKELLSECIEALLKQECDFLDVLIVDNASTDGTRRYIDKYIKNKRVLYENTGSNIGGAGGFNYGMKKGVELGYDYIWLMDDDTIVKKDSLTNLLKADEDLKGNYGFLSSRTLWTDESICLMNKQKEKLFQKKSKYPKIRFASFVSFFVKTDIIKEVGLPIKDFFIWSDDVEYSMRIQKKYNCYLVEDSEVIHKTKSNIGPNIAKDDERIDRYYYLFRNEMYIAKHNSILRKFYMLAVIIVLSLRVIFKSKNYKSKKLKVISKGVKDGFKFNPKVEYIKNQ